MGFKQAHLDRSGRSPTRAARRILPTFQEELDMLAQGHLLVAGVDEVGRGPLAGPVFAGAVILPPDWVHWRRRRPRRRDGARPHWTETDPRYLLRDSKMLSHDQLEHLYGIITAAAVTWGVGSASVQVIDTQGIVPATRLAMRQAIAALRPPPHALIVDAMDLSEAGLPCRAIIDADALCGSVSAASIVAKVTRDRLMRELDAQYPGYGFARHKGYATEEHLRLLHERGPCPIHRRSFSPVSDLLLRPRLL